MKKTTLVKLSENAVSKLHVKNKDGCWNKKIKRGWMQKKLITHFCCKIISNDKCVTQASGHVWMTGNCEKKFACSHVCNFSFTI